MEHRGKIIVLEGLDKSGKTTQAHLLQDYLNDRYPGRQQNYLSFPDYSTKIGEEIRSFLDGKVQYTSKQNTCFFRQIDGRKKKIF